MDRREFIKNLATGTGVALALPVGLGKIPNFMPESGLVNSDIESIKLSEVPELLKGYADKFKTWPELAQDQNKRFKQYIDSYQYVKRLMRQIREYFPNKTDQEISVLTNNLFVKRAQAQQKNKITFGVLRDGQKGKYTPEKNKTVIDSTNAGPYQDNQGNEIEKWDLFAVAHECEHTTQSHDLMLAGVFDQIIDSMVSNNSLEKESAEKIKNYVYTKAQKNNLLAQGRVDIEDEDEFNLEYYSQRPSEAMSYMMQIRMTLDTVSRHHPDLVKFDMINDDFKKEHLDLLKTNEAKLFQRMTLPKKKLKNITILGAMLMHFSEEDFINLMNRV